MDSVLCCARLWPGDDKLVDDESNWRGEEIVITKGQKPVARLVLEGRPFLSDVRNAVNELASLRHEMASRRGARLLKNKDIRDAVQKGRR